MTFTKRDQVKKLSRIIKKSREDPVWFVRNVIGAEPDDWQKSILRDIRDGKDPAARSGHGVGKTAGASWVILWWTFVHKRCAVPVTGPTETQLKDILWPELKKWYQGTLLEDYFDWKKSKYVKKHREETCRALYRTSSTNPDKMAGFHSNNLLYVVEEASGISDEVFPVIDGALSDGGQVLTIGNPTRSSGEFYEAFHGSSGLYSTYHISAKESPRVSDRWIERQAKKWGRDSDLFRVRVLGEFPKGTEDAYVPLEYVTEAMARDLDAEGPLSVGVDPARYGDDSTAIAPRIGPKLLTVDTHEKKGTQETAGIVIGKVRSWMETHNTNRARIKVDETGVGAGVVDRLEEEVEKSNKQIEVVGVMFNQKPTEGNGEKFKSAIDEMFDNFRQRGEEGDLDLPAGLDKLESHIAGRKYRTLPSGRVKMEPKKKFKKRVGESPDEGDSVLLSYYEPEAGESGGIGGLLG